MNSIYLKTTRSRRYSVTASMGCTVHDELSNMQLAQVGPTGQTQFTAVGDSVKVSDTNAILTDVTFTMPAEHQMTPSQIYELTDGNQMPLLRAHRVYDLGLITDDVLHLNTMSFDSTDAGVSTCELWMQTNDSPPSVIWPSHTVWIDSEFAPTLQANKCHCFALRMIGEKLLANLCYVYEN